MKFSKEKGNPPAVEIHFYSLGLCPALFFPFKTRISLLQGVVAHFCNLSTWQAEAGGWPGV